MDNAPPVKRKALYVEDNPPNAALMEALFERRPDLQLHLAHDCASALRLARAHQPDLLLLDLRLPDGDGWTLLPQLRALPGMQGVPAVAVTAADLRAMKLQGFNDLWPKPLNLLQMLDLLNHWLPERRSRPDQALAAGALAPVSGMTMR